MVDPKVGLTVPATTAIAPDTTVATSHDMTTTGVTNPDTLAIGAIGHGITVIVRSRMANVHDMAEIDLGHTKDATRVATTVPTEMGIADSSAENQLARTGILAATGVNLLVPIDRTVPAKARTARTARIVTVSVEGSVIPEDMAGNPAMATNLVMGTGMGRVIPVATVDIRNVPMVIGTIHEGTVPQVIQVQTGEIVLIVRREPVATLTGNHGMVQAAMEAVLGMVTVTGSHSTAMIVVGNLRTVMIVVGSPHTVKTVGVGPRTVMIVVGNLMVTVTGSHSTAMIVVVDRRTGMTGVVGPRTVMTVEGNPYTAMTAVGRDTPIANSVHTARAEGTVSPTQTGIHLTGIRAGIGRSPRTVPASGQTAPVTGIGRGRTPKKTRVRVMTPSAGPALSRGSAIGMKSLRRHVPVWRRVRTSHLCPCSMKM